MSKLPFKLHALTLLFASVAAFAAREASALPVSAALNLGKPLVFVDLNTQERKALGAQFALGADVNLFIPDYPFAAGVYFDSFFKSNFGDLPIANSGMQVSYYPFGKPIQVNNEEGQVLTKNLGLTTYGTLGTGLTFMNIREPNSIFGAAAFNMRISATLEYPMSEVWALGGSVLYQTTFGGQSAEPPVVTVGYTGWSLLTRVVFTIN
jgi:hypothetical protein